MDTALLSSLFATTGPFATVLTEVSHDSENGEHEHALRVRSACDELTAQGADERLVEFVRERLGELVEEPSPVSRLVVANADGMQYDDVFRARVDRPVATYGLLPDLGTWLEHKDARTTFVLAVVDHEGGDVAVYDSDVPEAEERESAGGVTFRIHKVSTGAWSEPQVQHASENVWAKNAHAVADRINEHVRDGERLVLLAGDPQSRPLVLERLHELDAEVVELKHGSRAEDGGDEALQQAVREALLEHAVARRTALTHELKDRLGRDYAATTGVRDVADAFVRGQVETLLIDPPAAAELELDPGEHPGLALGAVTAGGPLRADQALIAAAVLTDAAVSVSRAATLGGAPVAALLRWDQDAVGTES